MKLSVISIANGLVRVAAEGEVTVRDFRSEGRDPFTVLLGDRWAAHQVVIDMAGVSFLDSSAVGWFITCRREFDRSGGQLVLHSLQPRVRQVLDLLKVGRVVPLAPDEAAAMAVVAKAVAARTAQESPRPQAQPAQAQPPETQSQPQPVAPTGSTGGASSTGRKPSAAPKARRGTKAA